MQAGIVEHFEHQVIRGQDVCDQVLNSVMASNLCEPPKQGGSYSAQVIFVGDDNSDVGGCRFSAQSVVRDADQRSGFEGAERVVVAVAVSEFVSQGFQMRRVHCEESEVAFAFAERVMERDYRVDIRCCEPPQQHSGAPSKRRDAYIIHYSASAHRSF
jgi:hypothetical protein